MIFVKQNKVVPGGVFIKGRFMDDNFETELYQQELFQASELQQKIAIDHKSNKFRTEPDVSYILSFNHTDGHDGRCPMLASMRDWWGLNPRKAQVYLITQRPGCTSSKIQGREWNGKQRYIIFCEDWRPGQWWVFNDYSYVGWKAGTVLNFDFTKPHASANASECPTSILQIDQELENYQKEEYLETKINQ